MQASNLIKTVSATFFLCSFISNPVFAQGGSGTAVRPDGVPLPKGVKPYVFNVPGMSYASDIPVNFPLPSYTSNVTQKTFISTSKGPPSATATISTRDQINTVYEWYKSTCQRDGWNYKTPSPQAAGKISKSGPVYMINAKKDRNEVYIICHPDKKTSGTRITISWARQR